MLKSLKSTALRALVFLLLFMIVCGGIYPLVITGISQLVFPGQANGSIIETTDGKRYSTLLGQQFTGMEYLWGRQMSLNCETFKDEEGKPLMYAGASNKTPAGEEFEKVVSERVEAIRSAHPEMGDTPVPVDLVTMSGSGLDPEISVAAAEYQIQRIARERGIPASDVEAIIEKYTTCRFLGVLGEPVVNVLKVNLALDGVLKE